MISEKLMYEQEFGFEIYLLNENDYKQRIKRFYIYWFQKSIKIREYMNYFSIKKSYVKKS